jgi:NADH-quinone oxidoreductase subunit J
MTVVFYLSGIVAIISTLLVVLSFNAVHALLYLVVSFLAIAVVFFTLGAPFAAALEVIIYAGAILVLFVFVIMMISPGPRGAAQERGWFSPRAWIFPVILVLLLGAELVYLLTIAGRSDMNSVVHPQEVGAVLLGPYLIGVEIASFLLLAGLVGAYHLGYRFPWRSGRISEGDTT